jgi:putative protease
MGEEVVGKVTDYFAKIGVAGIQMTTGALNVGDTIRIKGHTTDVTHSSTRVCSEPSRGKPSESGSRTGCERGTTS